MRRGREIPLPTNTHPMLPATYTDTRARPITTTYRQLGPTYVVPDTPGVKCIYPLAPTGGYEFTPPCSAVLFRPAELDLHPRISPYHDATPPRLRLFRFGSTSPSPLSGSPLLSPHTSLAAPHHDFALEASLGRLRVRPSVHSVNGSRGGCASKVR